MVIVDASTYKNFIHDINGNEVFIDYVLRKNSIHTADNKPSVIFIKNIKNGITYVINVDHPDFKPINVDVIKLINLIIQLTTESFVVDKKKFLNLFKNKNVSDILIFDFQRGYEVTDLKELQTNCHINFQNQFGENYLDLNFVIPMSKHIERFEMVYNFFSESFQEFELDYSFEKMNGVITETLSEVECNGIHIDTELFNFHFGSRGLTETGTKVFSEYNLFTSTGRPSNRFARVNYAALNKDNGCRTAFTSRFGENGTLLGLDYRAYHPHIVANLINFKLDLETDVYEFLGKSYFHKDVLTTEEIKLSKNQTFQNFYGGIKDEYLNIEFFKKVHEYVTHRWQFFERNGYVETPVFKRRITEHHISDPNPNKLFNYLLQAAETEFSIQSISRINDFLRNRESKVVLYTYDSILVDLSKNDGIETVKCIKNTMIDNQFPVRCYVGKNYNDLCEIQIQT